VIKRFAVLFASIVLLIPVSVMAGTIVRGTKTSAGGGTAFVDDTIIEAAEFNTDFDTIYSEFNGSIEAANIATGAVATAEILNGTILDTDVAAAAAIAYSKFAQTAAAQDADIVDDYSADAAEQLTSSSPGTVDTPTLATNLETEIEQRRFIDERTTIGTTTTEFAGSAGTAADAGWLMSPVRGPNLIRNGGFDSLNTLTISVDGDGWTRILTPTTLAAEALVESEGQGDGNGINIIDTGAALAGIEQVLDGLKADTFYLAQVWTRDDVGVCRLSTTGADTNDCEVDSDDTGNWQLLKCVFETDSTPANVEFELIAVSQSDDCVFEDAGVYEINTDPIPVPGVIVAYDDNGSTETNFTATYGDVGGIANLAVTPPSPNYSSQCRRLSVTSLLELVIVRQELLRMDQVLLFLSFLIPALLRGRFSCNTRILLQRPAPRIHTHCKWIKMLAIVIRPPAKTRIHRC
jgi:hypothetical protein